MEKDAQLGLWFPCLTFSSLIAIVIRWAVSLHPYSGERKPPMFGDFEAQRHWMEITVNLPVSEWYFNSSKNDLMYWGLDYPPLTAYHMQLCGTIAEKINSTWVALYSSRGLESYDLRLFMRYTVLVADVLVYFPAVCVFCKLFCQSTNTMYKAVVALVMLLQPSLILIDHGHFQYNCVSLGLTLWGVVGLGCGHDLLGSIAFTLALNYKQMELYHAIPFFCYLLGKCLHEDTFYRKFVKLGSIGCAVLATFLLCWFPFLTSKEMVMQVVHRVFPFARGLFEDKVANFWCTLSLIVKMKNVMSQAKLVQLAFATTFVLVVPSSLNLLMKPTFKRFLIGLANSSLVFFLFSYQVHEKSILLAALPLILLLPNCSFPIMWFHTVATFSMSPLLLKDGLLIATTSLLVIFVTATLNVFNPLQSTRTKFTYVASCLGMASLQFGLSFVTPPEKYPDLFQFRFDSSAVIYWSPNEQTVAADVDKKTL
ncbi:dolichyl pyrophosphate Man9GlcNAc2 alpha-1,3-glucosyltransferase-like isoform X2 [Corticium candelabrum]|uniref:dolichyl pyrophosphate Man9GlcNAc2 alpha-1,3-glucosyltransferase-like isoform X2 n=1 Tax=Corticium candelabrum TaxID=121492 RepID=UPI002E273DBC|nr:dolichyl pyrophosphate Man9GlcNAc2 alpha-1,3-glucosyltransferase-like isoform X2 [Corticium candelabrum]